MSEASLEDVLNGVDAPEAEPVSEVVDEVVEEKLDTTAEETSQEAEPDATAATEKAPEKDAEQEWTYHAVKDERQKRQQAEERTKELETQLQQSKVEPKPEIDLFENPEGYTKALKDDFSVQLANERANTSEFYARREFADLDDKLEVFNEISKANPALLSQVQGSISPWHEMYEIAKSHAELQEMKDIDGYKAKIRAEVEADIRKEIETGQKADTDKRESIPPSLASKRSSGGHTNPSDSSLEEILGR